MPGWSRRTCEAARSEAQPWREAGEAQSASKRACPGCGAPVGEEARFCAACGTPLGAPAAAPDGAGAAASPSGERRHLTVLFADLAGSTELAGAMDAEAWLELMRDYQREAGGTVARFGGHVAQHLGDGLLAYFGWPQAYGDDAERAVRAGLAIVEAVRARESMRVRVGIHTGPVVVGAIGTQDRVETLALGEAPNVAARLQSLCEPGAVLISEITNRLVSGLFVVEDAGSQPLKGVRGPLGLFRVVQPSGVRGRLAVAGGAGLTPFVGREQERALLRDRFERSREGEGQVVLLVGEPGIGKSRLAQQLREDLAGSPHTWLESAAGPYYTSTPFYGVTELLGKLFVWEKDATEARIAALERALEAAGLDLAQALPLVAPLVDLPVPPHYPPVLASPEVAHRRLLHTLVRWTLATAGRQPLVILLEDLQWADPSTLELQALLVEQGATLPLLLVYTARGEFRPPWRQRAHHTQLTLDRLPRRHTREMVRRLGTRVGLEGELLEAVVGRADGVPLFVEELTKAVTEARVAAVMDEIPETLQDSLMARLDRLGPDMGDEADAREARALLGELARGSAASAADGKSKGGSRSESPSHDHSTGDVRLRRP